MCAGCCTFRSWILRVSATCLENCVLVLPIARSPPYNIFSIPKFACLTILICVVIKFSVFSACPTTCTKRERSIFLPTAEMSKENSTTANTSTSASLEVRAPSAMLLHHKFLSCCPSARRTVVDGQWCVSKLRRCASLVANHSKTRVAKLMAAATTRISIGVGNGNSNNNGDGGGGG